MTDHSIISPSSAHRWMICSGSPLLSKLCPESEPGEASVRGTMMHRSATGENVDGLTADENDMVRGYMKTIPAQAEVEQRTRDESLVHPMHFGTLDAWWINKDHLHIVDFKTGKWAVDQIGNWQLIGYASEFTHLTIRSISLGIYQPKVSKTTKWWHLTAETFKPYADAYKAGAHKVFDKPELVPGDHCKFCPAKNICPKVRSLLKPANTEW